MSQSRKHRGYRTQRVWAQYLARHGFPFAEPVGAGRAGSDITGTIGIDWELKARADFNPKATLAQLRDRAVDDDLRIAVLRCNGQGEESVGQWVVLMDASQLISLLRKSGYGEGEL